MKKKCFVCGKSDTPLFGREPEYPLAGSGLWLCSKCYNNDFTVNTKALREGVWYNEVVKGR